MRNIQKWKKIEQQCWRSCKYCKKISIMHKENFFVMKIIEEYENIKTNKWKTKILKIYKMLKKKCLNFKSQKIKQNI